MEPKTLCMLSMPLCHWAMSNLLPALNFILFPAVSYRKQEFALFYFIPQRICDPWLFIDTKNEVLKS